MALQYSVEEFDWTKERYFIAIDILNVLINNKKNLSLSDIARRIDMSPTSPTYQIVIAYLLDEGVIGVKEIIGNIKIIGISEKSFVDLLYDTDIFEKTSELISIKNRFWGVWKY
mgnify:CR=1 FL=1|jgi:hypothetical protein